jgi:hypothetical protein
MVPSLQMMCGAAAPMQTMTKTAFVKAKTPRSRNPRPAFAGARKEQKFFASFFQKRSASLPKQQRFSV